MLIAALVVVAGVLSIVRGAPSEPALPAELVHEAVVRASAVDRLAALPAHFEPPWSRGVPAGVTAVVTRGEHPRPEAEFVEGTRGPTWVRWELADPPEAAASSDQFVFGEHLAEAHVSIGGEDDLRICDTWLFGRWQCGPNPWNYVGAGEVRIRGRSQSCIWAHPSDEGPVNIEFRDIALGNLISGRHMLADVGVSNGTPGDIVMRVWIDDTLLGERTQTQRQGLNTFRFPISDPPDTGTVRFEISADVTAQRHFCFTAQSRRSPAQSSRPELGRTEPVPVDVPGPIDGSGEPAAPPMAPEEGSE